MTKESVPIALHPNDEVRAWATFPASYIQIALHNYCVSQIERVRTALEHCGSHELNTLQGEIRAYRAMLGTLHKKDPEVYA